MKNLPKKPINVFSLFFSLRLELLGPPGGARVSGRQMRASASVLTTKNIYYLQTIQLQLELECQLPQQPTPPQLPAPQSVIQEGWGVWVVVMPATTTTVMLAATTFPHHLTYRHSLIIIIQT